MMIYLSDTVNIDDKLDDIIFFRLKNRIDTFANTNHDKTEFTIVRFLFSPLALNYWVADERLSFKSIAVIVIFSAFQL